MGFFSFLMVIDLIPLILFYIFGLTIPVGIFTGRN